MRMYFPFFIFLLFLEWTVPSMVKAEAQRVIKPSDWIIIGPFENPEGKGFDIVYPPEREIQLDVFYRGKWGRIVNWQKLYWMNSSMGERLFLSRFFPENSVAYVFTILHSSKTREVLLKLENDGGVKVWLNEKEILACREKCTIDDVPIELEKGWNQILVKICAGKRGKGFLFRISSKEGESLSDLICRLPERTYGANKAALLSSLFPGCGHIYLGDFKKGLLLLGGELALFSSSLIFDRNALSRLFSGKMSEEEESIKVFLSNPPLIGAVKLPYLSAYLAYRKAREESHNVGYRRPLSDDSVKDLAKAPLDLNIIAKPDFFLPFAFHLGGTLALLVILDEKISSGDSARGSVRVYKKKLHPLIGYPSGETGMFLSFTVVAMGEEGLFRGYLQSELEERFGRRWGWLAASTLFGAMHISNGSTTEERLTASLSALTTGLILGYFYQKEDYSLRKPIAYHTWWNFSLGTIDFLLNPQNSMISGGAFFRF